MAMGCAGAIDVAIIITNYDYKSGHPKLPGAENDGDMMSKMLQNYNKQSNKTVIMTATNVNVKRELRKFKKKIRGKKGKDRRQIQNLHFHFSGHGEFRETDKSAVHAQHLIGSDGVMLSDFDLKNMLLGWKAEKITITLDCCRGPATPTRSCATQTTLGDISSVANQEKIFVLYATLEMHTSSDENSLTKELFKVTEEGGKPIPICDLAEEINNSWKARMIEGRMVHPNICKDDMVKVQGNWKDFTWPTEIVIGEDQGKGSEEEKSKDLGKIVEKDKCHELDDSKEVEEKEKKEDKENKKENTGPREDKEKIVEKDGKEENKNENIKNNKEEKEKKEAGNRIIDNSKSNDDRDTAIIEIKVEEMLVK